MLFPTVIALSTTGMVDHVKDKLMIQNKAVND